MDKIKFASLIGYLSLMTKQTFTQDTITEIDNLINAGISLKFEPATHDQIVTAAGIQVKEMLNAMRDRKLIEAVRACRMLTGLGLKEAKDAIEDARRPYPGQI